MLDASLESGVFRSGILGANAYVSNSVKMLNNEDNFFNIKTQDLDSKKDINFTKKEK
jgi:hypothetical protein